MARRELRMAFPHGEILRRLNEAPGTLGVFFEIHQSSLLGSLCPPGGTDRPCDVGPPSRGIRLGFKMVCLIRHNKRGNRLAMLALTQQQFEEVPMTRDPRSEAEKARAALARNAEMGLGVPQSPAEEQPSVTPE